METVILENVSKSYGRIKAVENLSLKVNEGEIYGFIGPNGAGKSTTIRMLLNFIKAVKGSIKVLGYSPLTHEVEIKKTHRLRICRHLYVQRHESERTFPLHRKFSQDQCG